MRLYDTTLRDGMQGREINLTLTDKISVVGLLDSVGMDYIELGWPASNPKDMEAFRIVSGLRLKNSRISAFSSTRKKGTAAADDPGLRAVIESKAPVACIFGKTCLEHVRLQLKATAEENLEMIFDSVKFLKDSGLEVFYDAEHLFDGYISNKEYAIKCIKAAKEAGADVIVLCDTNGGTLPSDILRIVSELKGIFEDTEFGIHCHNDSGCAVANSLVCADYVSQIQGTINGFGERTGNADLVQIIPALHFKLGLKTSFDIKRLKEVSERLYMLANLKDVASQPYVGKNAFAHKAGVHVDAISKGARYEHIEPSSVGNERSIVLSDLSGSANVIEVLAGYGIKTDKNDVSVRLMLDKIKSLERKGYDIADLEAEKYLLSHEFFFPKKTFKVLDWKITTGMNDGMESSECTLVGEIYDEKSVVHMKVDNQGPVDSAYLALRDLLSRRFGSINSVKLINYKVMIAEDRGAESSVRVYIEFEDDYMKFATTGVSKNILEASMEAIEKAFRYYILKNNLN